MSPGIRIRELVYAYRFEPVLAIDQLELTSGRVHLAGANGAGKTTLLEILATLRSPDSGRVDLAGCRLPDEAARARGRLGFAGHDPSLHPDLTTRQALHLHARLHGCPSETVDRALDAWDLDASCERRVAELSHGQRRRADLARALLHEPEVLLLDEPGRGLDPEALATLEERIERSETGLVLVASPDDPPVETRRTVRLADGRLAEASP